VTLDTLRRRIISLELPPGAALSENELSAELGVSRTPVRESLILLRGEGLVEVFPQVGTFVSLVDPDRVAQAQFVREAIECSSLQSVELPLPLDDHAALTENLSRQDAAAADGRTDDFFDLDEEFHHTLLRIAGHETAWSTVTSAKAHLDRARRMSLVDTRPLDTLVAQHRSVADALAAGQRDVAVERLRTHLRAVFEDVETIRAARPDLFSDAGSGRPTRRAELSGSQRAIAL
jgi:DNA-binding GntR family transcriptional regulator